MLALVHSLKSCKALENSILVTLRNSRLGRKEMAAIACGTPLSGVRRADLDHG
jgi:hypothetical protein